MSERGQSLVEFAISFVIIMFLLVGAAEFSVSLFQLVQLRDAVQEGAVFGSQCNCTLEEIEDRVRGSSTSPMNLYDDSVSISITARDLSGSPKPVENSCESDALEVRASYTHKVIMPILPRLIGRDYILLNAAVTNTVLRPVCS